MYHCRLVILLAASLALTVAAPASAQSSELQPGARVRLTAPGVLAGKFVGTVVARSADTLTVASPGVAPVAIANARITSLEVSRGSSRLAGAGRGALWGGGIGVGIGLIVAAGTDHNEYAYYENSSAAIISYGLLSGAFYGTVIGAIVGRERWDRFDLAPRVSVTSRGGRPTLAVRLAF